MRKEKIAFIINPISGHKKGKGVEKKIGKYLSDIYAPVFFYTEYSGHACTLTQQCIEKGIQIIVAVGGDGTINEIAASLIGTNITLGIIPLGSGNGLARHHHIPVNIKKSIGVLNSGKIIQIDVGQIGNEYFFCTSGVGFDALISKKFNDSKRRGFLSYAAIVAREFTRFKAKKYRLEIDGVPKRVKAFILTISNANQYGNNFIISPKAVTYDGVLDISIIKPFPKWKVLGLLIKIVSGKLLKSEYYETLHAQKVELEKPKKNFFHIDGDPVKIKDHPVKISLLEQELNIIVPMGFL